MNNMELIGKGEGPNPDIEELVCAVYDRVGDIHHPMFTVINDAIAIRSFVNAINDPNSDLSKDPDDYELVCLGVWNRRTGVIDREMMGTLAEGQKCVRKDNEISNDA